MEGSRTRWEIGSNFEWRDEYLAPTNSDDHLPEHSRLYSSGRGALISLARLHARIGARPTVHLPAYFCPRVVGTISRFFPVQRYRHIPGSLHPDWGSIRASDGDLVVAVNFFGVHGVSDWNAWMDDHPALVLVEDHSHDPFSAWARSSTAHYAFASLTKSLPLPDGGLLWSPRGLPLPEPKDTVDPEVDYGVLAMLLKRSYLHGAGIEKESIRRMFERCRKHAVISQNKGSLFTEKLLPLLDIDRFRSRRRDNTRQFIERMNEVAPDQCRPLFDEWPHGHAPLNPVLLCATPAMRDDLRSHLIARRIYPPVHWELNGNEPPGPDDPTAIELSKRVLTVPVDFRYSPDDVDRVANEVITVVRSPARSQPVQRSGL